MGCGSSGGAQSLLLADFHMRHFESDTRSAMPLLDVPVSTSQIVPVLEAAAGIAWGWGPWEISGGYEMSNWFNMADIDRSSQSLFIDGAFVRLAFSHSALAPVSPELPGRPCRPRGGVGAELASPAPPTGRSLEFTAAGVIMGTWGAAAGCTPRCP